MPIALKILLLTRSLEIGGAERQICELAIGLHRAGWVVKVVTFYSGGELESSLHEAGVPLVSLNKRGRWDILSFILRLTRLLRTEHSDIIHSYLGVPNILIALLRPLLPNSRLIWGVRDSNIDLARYDWLTRIEFRLTVLCARIPDLIICNSRAGLDYHVSCGFPRHKMVQIPNGIDTARFRPDPVARQHVRAEWGIGEAETLVGLVARFDPMKGHSTFIRSATRISSALPRVRFVLVGGGSPVYRCEMEVLAESMGLGPQLVWAGPRVDMQRVYNALDLAVSSSSFGEGFPNAVAEAMSTGVACVVTDVGDSATVVGDAGWICAPEDDEALARTIIQALESMSGTRNDPRKRICANYSTAALLAATMAQLSTLKVRATICGELPTQR